MNQFRLLVLYNPAEGDDDAFTSWLESHVPEFLESPGAVAGTRYQLAELRPTQDPFHKYMTIYEIETDLDIQSYHQMLRSRSQGRAPVVVFERESLSARFFELLSD